MKIACLIVTLYAGPWFALASACLLVPEVDYLSPNWPGKAVPFENSKAVLAPAHAGVSVKDHVVVA